MKKRFRMYSNKISIIGAALIVMLLTGCGSNANTEEKQVKVYSYDRVNYNTVDVIKGDLQPVVELSLKTDDFERTYYRITKDQLDVDTLYISEGDHVSEGEIMVTFKSGDIQSKVDQYNEHLQEDMIMLEHYNNLKSIENTTAYDNDIRLIDEDITVTKLYIEEISALLDSYSIKAKKAGTVMDVSDSLYYGEVTSSENLLSVVSGSGEYYDVTTEADEFVIGETYQATFGVATYDLKLLSIEADETTEDSDKLVFAPISDMSGISEGSILKMIVYKDEYKDAIYIPDDCIEYNEGKYYVYVINENGYRDARYIEIGDSVDGNTIVLSGLEAGEKVVVR